MSDRCHRGWARCRSLRVETLEARHLLAGVTVTNSLDVVNGMTTSIADLLANDGGDGISLREAILAANASAEDDTITFDPTLFESDAEILLTEGEFEIVGTLTIDGSGAGSRVVIDAQHQSRIFNASPLPSGDLHLVGLDLRNGEADSGGAISFTPLNPISVSHLTVTDSILSNSRTRGDNTRGGAIYSTSGHVEITNSLITGNRALGYGAAAGAILASSGSLTIRSSVISNNGTEGNIGWAGALLSWSAEILVVDSTVTGNFTLGDHAVGGAIHSVLGQVRVVDSVISGNFTAGDRSHGGAIDANSVRLTRAVVTDNYTSGDDANGGAISAGGVRDVASQFGRNHTAGIGSDGGAIYAGSVLMEKSLIYDNFTSGQASSGGGMWVQDGTITGSTISGNQTYGNGGGIAWQHSNPLEILESTIANNRALGPTSQGGGLWHASGTLTIRNSIIAGNFNTDEMSPDVKAQWNVLNSHYNIIGNTQGLEITAQSGTGNLLNVDPLLAPLAYNGGGMKVHALLPGSPALNAGDPNRQFDSEEYDGRGAPYARVAQGRLDIGAYEAQGVVTAAPGDFNRDGTVDLKDFPLWRNQLDTSDIPPLSAADGDGDGMVSSVDYLVWKSHFGFEYNVPPTEAAIAALPRLEFPREGVSSSSSGLAEKGSSRFSRAVLSGLGEEEGARRLAGMLLFTQEHQRDDAERHGNTLPLRRTIHLSNMSTMTLALDEAFAESIAEHF